MIIYFIFVKIRKNIWKIVKNKTIPTDDEIIINIPKYIGFLDILNIPDETKLFTFLKLWGLIVVLDLINWKTGMNIINKPVTNNVKESGVLNGKSNPIKNLEDK